MALAKSVGTARNNEITSNKFDFPDPFGPINTFRACRGIASLSGANDNIPCK